MFCKKKSFWQRFTCTVNCNNKNKNKDGKNVAKCDQELVSTEEDCNLKPCPKNDYGKWSSWTPCSISCKSSVNDRSVSIFLCQVKGLFKVEKKQLHIWYCIQFWIWVVAYLEPREILKKTKKDIMHLQLFSAGTTIFNFRFAEG